MLTATMLRTEYSIGALQSAAAAGDTGMQRLMAATGEPGPTCRALDALRLRLRVPGIAKRL